MAPPFISPSIPPPLPSPSVVPLPSPPSSSVPNTAPSPVPLYANPIHSPFPTCGHTVPPPLPPPCLPPAPAKLPASFGMVFQVASQHYHRREPPPALPPPPMPAPLPDATRSASRFPNYGYAASQREEMMVVATKAPAPLTMANSPDRVSEAAKLARIRALEVLESFQKRDDYLQKQIHSQTEISRKRKACLEKLEERKKVAMIKNLEYLARVEDERLHTRIERCQEAQNYHSRMEDYHELVLKRRSDQRSFNRQSQAGLGTTQQKKAEARQRRHKQQPRGNTGKPDSSPDTIALYLSNLPTDGSSSSSTEELLAALFGNLGYDLQKIHVYKHKATGAPKGDALAIYRLPPPTTEDASDNAARERIRATLIETVCSQMNGAELPDGNVISVQPSDSSHKRKKKGEELLSHYGPSDTKNDETAGDGDGGDDLDGFFASINGDGREEGRARRRDEQPTSKEQSNEGREEGKEALGAAGDDNESDLDEFFESLV